MENQIKVCRNTKVVRYMIVIDRISKVVRLYQLSNETKSKGQDFINYPIKVNHCAQWLVATVTSYKSITQVSSIKTFYVMFPNIQIFVSKWKGKFICHPRSNQNQMKLKYSKSISKLRMNLIIYIIEIRSKD